MARVPTQHQSTERRWMRSRVVHQAALSLVALSVIGGCSLPGSSKDDSPSTTIAVELVDPATFQAQGTRESWCAAAPDGVARPLGDKAIFLGEAEPMKAAFQQENAILAELEPAVPPELGDAYVSAVNGTRLIEASMAAADYKLEDTGTEFGDADRQLSVAWNTLNGYSRSECG